MKNPFLIGSKIYLRPLEREDAGTVLPWVNDPEVTCNLLLYRPVNLQAEEEFIAKANQSEHDLVLGIAVAATDKLIGATGLDQIDFKNRQGKQVLRERHECGERACKCLWIKPDGALKNEQGQEKCQSVEPR